MSKRTNPSNDAPQAKRSRKLAGFRLARQFLPTSETSGSNSSSSKTSLFITVNQPDERRGALRAQTRLLSGTPEPLAQNSGNLQHGAEAEEGYAESQLEVERPEQNAKPKRKRYTRNLDRLNEWLQFRATFLDEALRHDGCGDFVGQTMCSSCGNAPGSIKCKDCPTGRMLKCAECVVALHQALPLHRIERWNGKFFDKDTLQNHGHRYQLGHSGAPCPCPQAGPKNFVVFDTSGPHFVAIDYCHCGDDPLTHWTQLLREQWFPATLTRPQTVFTFDSLETFHELTLQGKTNVYDYYNTLIRRFDNANIANPIKRYSEIHRAFRMWRNLMALKRAGRGHDPGGIDSTLKGELMVECPACPHPGRNLPDDWKNAGPLLFLYTLFIAVDGNFKLKGKQRHLKDVELMPGWGAYVPEEEYQAHIANYIDQPEINTCESQHDALVRAATRSSPGYAVSGTVAVICSRHCLIRKNGAGDLQKGEKYCNVDFIIFAALIGVNLLRIILTYDIACQWSTNFRKRMEEFPEEMQITNTTQVDVAIPGWHINGHGKTCREKFNLSYMEGAGRTVGEDIETTWAGTNPLAPSVREMGPAARHDTLNDHWNGWNFRKIVGFRLLFLKRFKEAFTMNTKQTDVFNKFSATFSPETVKRWEATVVAWNANPKAPNPYKEPKSGTTLQDVRLQLAQEEAAQVAIGNVSRHKIGLPAFLMIGFDLEETQYLIRREVTQTKGLRTSKQLADLQDKRNGLLRQIQNWRDVQLVYTPHVASLLSQSPSPPDTNSHSPSSPPETLPENIPLYMPSSLPPHIRTLPELSEICQLERRLREPQADDALSEVRRQRRVTQGLWQFKRINASGTGNKPNTRMISLYKRFDNKTKRAAQKYRVAWQALRVLDPNGAWSDRLRELKDADISGPGKDPDDRSTSNSRYEPSWIWLVPRIADGSNVEEEFNDSMRVEWAKARARMIRWREELLLVQEEMRRVIAYHEWRAGWWRERSTLRTNGDPSILSGLSGYAHKQAALCTRMAERCALYWLRDLKEKGIMPSWATGYEDMLSQLPHRHAATQLDDECEGMALDEEWEDMAVDNVEGNEGDEDKSGDEDEGDSDVGDDDYDDFDFGD